MAKEHVCWSVLLRVPSLGTLSHVGEREVGWVFTSPYLSLSVGEMLNCGEMVPFFFTVVSVLISVPSTNRAHLVGEIFCHESVWPQGCGRKLKAFKKDLVRRIFIIFFGKFFFSIS